MKPRRLFRLFLAISIAGSFVLAPFQPVLLAQNEKPTYLPLVSAPGSPVTPGQDMLFRTRVSVRTSVQWRDLERMQPVFLDRGDDWALVIVDDVQLTDLARLRYNPDGTSALGGLVAANAATNRTAASSLRPLLQRAEAAGAAIAAAEA
ncbi:MAG: hypothetical protein ACK2UO_08565, partial [Caldilineaceae bacterium]